MKSLGLGMGAGLRLRTVHAGGARRQGAAPWRAK
jgi:hypothetical protein